MGSRLARFCGKFEDKHTDSPNASDDEEKEGGNDEEDMFKPKDYKKMMANQRRGVISSLKKKKTATKDAPSMGSDAVATQFWNFKTTTVTVEDQAKGGIAVPRYADAIICKNEKVGAAEMKKLKNYTNMHTIELIKCGLKDCPPSLIEIDALRVLRLSRNDIKTLRSHLTKSQNRTSSLQRLVVDENSLSLIETGTLAGDQVKELIVLNLAKNCLSMLPSDFLLNATQLEICDLSYNTLEILPDSILECRSLRILDICNNRMVELPQHINKLMKLRKLFAHGNRLSALPEGIGKCQYLEKLWLSANKLRYLPFSIIPLWKGEGGHLEEITVDDNPLVAPSVTAFQMGGADQMFKLFKEFVAEETRRQHEQKEKAIADAPSATEKLALRDAAYPDGDATAMVPINDEGHAMIPEKSDIEGVALMTGRTEAGDSQRNPSKGSPNQGEPVLDYYFYAYRDDPEGISKIRSAESSMMLLKRQYYLEQIKHRATQIAAEARKAGTTPPKYVEKYANHDFNVSSFNGRVHVTDIDLFFCLLVVAVKPLCSTCSQLFSKYTEDGKFHRKNWEDFCARSPATLPEEAKGLMWKLVTWQSPDQELATIDQMDFIAALHIHDLDQQDPFLMRCAQVLKLMYYNMSMLEFEEKIRSRGSDVANAVEGIDFPSEDEDMEEQPLQQEVREGAMAYETEPETIDGIPVVEGERRAMHGNLARPARGPTNAEKRKPLVSMSEAQYTQLHNRENNVEDSEEESQGFELSSSVLSGEDLSESSFDAEDCMDVLEQRKEEEARARKEAEVPKEAFKIQNDADLSTIMNMSPSEIVRQPAQEQTEDKQKNLMAAKRKEEREKLAAKKLAKSSAVIVRDPRFGTNMMGVRRALREAYRNLPFTDFVAFVNFLLRGLKRMKHLDAATTITYWHVDDPVVRHLMGEQNQNPYPTAVLNEMGFVRVFDSYWVWPYKHLKPTMGSNMNRLVPPHCMGLEKMRLDDLVKLITHCRKSLERAGKKFTGHCRAS